MRIGSITLPARRGRLMRSDAVQRLLAFAALIVIIIIFSLLTPNFLQFDNAIGILLATTVNGILALGVTFVIISGGIDLSIGTVMRSEEHTSELQSLTNLVCRLLLEKKKKT